jgi:hypothetical protein
MIVHFWIRAPTCVARPLDRGGNVILDFGAASAMSVRRLGDLRSSR